MVPEYGGVTRMSKFLKDDLVRVVVDEYLSARRGDVGTVVETPYGPNGGYDVEIPGKRACSREEPFYFYESEVEPAPVEVGSRVRVTDRVPEHVSIEAGALGTVIKGFGSGPWQQTFVEPDEKHEHEGYWLRPDEVRAVATPKPVVLPKVGDRVVLLDTWGYITGEALYVGAEGTVVRIASRADGRDLWVRLSDNQCLSFAPEELELADEPEPEAPEPTVVELITQALEQVKAIRGPAIPKDYARDFSLAITHLEDAQYRFTRGMAQKLGVFAPADLEKIGDDPAAASKFLADRDQKAADAAVKL